MDNLNAFYHGILNDLEFSISGYPNIEKNDDDKDFRIKEKIKILFDKICKSPVFVGKKNLGFVSYAYSIIDKIEPFKIHSIVGTSFYFNSFQELSFEKFIVCDYVLFKEKIKTYLHSNITVEDLNSSIKTSELTSILFVNPTNYRIKTTENINAVVKYDKHIDTIVFEVPFSSIFKCTDIEHQGSVKGNLFNYYEQYLSENHDLKHAMIRIENVYNNTKENDAKFILDSFIDENGVKKIIETIYKKLILLEETNGYYFFGKNVDKKNIDAYAKLIVSHAFLSAMFNCWVENIPSVIKVEEKLCIKKCLGNIIIGYKIEEEITATERIYFKLLSERISNNLAAQCVIDINRDINIQAVRAAISQVMARNMSHNIGSHVMNKLIDAIYLEKFCSYSNCLKSYKPASDFKETIDHTAFKQLAIYNNYVKCRMDYLSDMSFGTPLMQTSKKMFEDVFQELDKVRLLLENISGLGDNFIYSIKLEIVSDDGNVEEVNTRNDFALALPNDILGCQAFYNIIENVIRNTAKHATTEPNVKTQFTIRFREIDDNSIAVLQANEKEEAHGWMCVEIYDNIHIDGINKLVNDQNEKLNKPILNKSNQLRSNSLGLLEMEASAAYLRKLDSNTIDDEIYELEHNANFYNKHGKINILKAVSIESNKDESKKHHLGYRFFMLKPMEVLIVTDLQLDTDNNKAIQKEKALKKGGVWVVNSNKFVEHLITGKVYNHQFVVHVGQENKKVIDTIKNHKTGLPIRVLEVTDINTWFKSVDYDAKNIIKYCWIKWIEKLGIDSGLIGNSVPCACQNQPPEACTVDGKFRVVFIDHDKKNWLNYKNCAKASFIEVLSSRALGKLPSILINEVLQKNDLTPFATYVRNLKSRHEGKPKFDVQFNQILESSYAKIVVIDERIQKFAEQEYFKDTTYFDYFNSMNITLPLMPFDKKCPYNQCDDKPNESRFNFSANEISESYSIALKDTIKYWCKNLNNNDIVLIHYSLLERAFKSEANKLEAINSFIEDVELNCQLILTTGRGIIPGLTPKARFINLSPVITSFVEIGNKHLINYILNSTRKL